MLARLAVSAVAVGVLASAAGANLFVNPGFEDPITQDGPPFVGFWEGFSSGAPNTLVFNSSVFPRSGAMHAELSILGDNNSFAGVFQDVGVLAGEVYTFSGWYAAPTHAPMDVGIEYRIEWRDSVMDVEIGRTPNSTLGPASSAYEMFSLSAMAPPGADQARVVYAIQTFAGDGPTNSGIIYLDDLRFVPAPGSAGALSLGGLLAARRRRAAV